MNLTSINYGVTLNVGNYESIRFDATAQINEGEDPQKIKQELITFVNYEASAIARRKKQGGQ